MDELVKTKLAQLINEIKSRNNAVNELGSTTIGIAMGGNLISALKRLGYIVIKDEDMVLFHSDRPHFKINLSDGEDAVPTYFLVTHDDNLDDFDFKVGKKISET